MSFPEIVIENEPQDRIRAGANIHQDDRIDLPPLPQAKKRVEKLKPSSEPSQEQSEEEYDGPSVDIVDSEAEALKTDLDATQPLALPPDPKKFGSSKEGIVFYDKNSFTTRGPMLHKDIAKILPRTGEK